MSLRFSLYLYEQNETKCQREMKRTVTTLLPRVNRRLVDDERMQETSKKIIIIIRIRHELITNVALENS